MSQDQTLSLAEDPVDYVKRGGVVHSMHIDRALCGLRTGAVVEDLRAVTCLRCYSLAKRLLKQLKEGFAPF